MTSKLLNRFDRTFLLLLVILLLTMQTTRSFQPQDQNIEIASVDTLISTWDTSLISSGSSTERQIRLPLESDGNYDFVVNWGDGSSSRINRYDEVEVTHTYSSEGIYNLTFDGTFSGWGFDDDRIKIIDISQWGNLQLGNSGNYFEGALNLQISATDVPDLSETNNFNKMFYKASSFNQDIGNWDVSNVTNTKYMFARATSFNQSIEDWDVSNVIDMEAMFYSASSFDQDIGNWDVSSVTNMRIMLHSGTLSIVNYDSLLISWAELTLQSGVNFHAGNSVYSNKSAVSKQKIIDKFAWKIIDGGEEPSSLETTTDSLIEPSSSETTEDAFLNVPQFYAIGVLFLIVVIRRRIIKKNTQR